MESNELADVLEVIWRVQADLIEGGHLPKVRHEVLERLKDLQAELMLRHDLPANSGRLWSDILAELRGEYTLMPWGSRVKLGYDPATGPFVEEVDEPSDYPAVGDFR